ncbi:MAG: hypothetical protein NTU97_02440, partial [Candidatus Magasanikbacteria bacterium]|nr:hypothetical protein [Candidatus Magasanikbacteria bacterium]
GGEAVFLFQSDKGGVNVTAKPVNLNPSTANTDAFVLEGACVPSACKTFGYLAANWNAEVDELGVGKLYYIVIDGFNGAAASFNLQVTCKETECAGGVDNDDDGLVDCADPDCFADSNCTAKREVCIGGVDEDLDGKTDCADPDCRFDNNCVSSCATQDQITCGESKIDNTLSYSNMISGYDCAALDESGPEKAYIFTAETSGTITISLSNLGADMDVFVLEDLCQANECLGWGNNSTTVQVVAGHTYYVVVDGFAGSSGSYTVSLNCFPVQ